ncbi:3-oxoacyl-ACP synthase III family protein [Dactylosporangium sp. NPDC005555]|uniref:3-oxoacyl-ACP synthase III family protein n=1 Tax=Dactylosporangium sp. NPDC005555 TaxID=3154889 RepID=UPI0033BBB18B
MRPRVVPRRRTGGTGAPSIGRYCGVEARDVRLASAGTALPGEAVDNALLTKSLGMSPVFQEWIDTFVGTRSRYLAIDLGTGDVSCSVADLGVQAAGRALDAAGIDAGAVDLVVMATSMPDRLLPTTAEEIADRLGVGPVPVHQLQSGCTGAVQALDLAHQALLAGDARTALVIGGDVCAKHVDLRLDYSRLPPAEMVNAVLFGDGAGAVVLGDGADFPDAPVLRRVLLELTGLHRPPAQIVEWFGPADSDPATPAVWEDFKAVQESVPVIAAEILAELLRDLRWTPADIDYLLPPQLSGRMTEDIVRRLGVPAAVEVSCVADTGNTANALPFTQLQMVLPELVSGDRVVAISVESSKWIRAGFVLEKP